MERQFRLSHTFMDVNLRCASCASYSVRAFTKCMSVRRPTRRPRLSIAMIARCTLNAVSLASMLVSPHGQAGWLVYEPRSQQLRVSGDVDFDETFVSQGPARHFAFMDALSVHTAQSRHMIPDAFVSSVLANDCRGSGSMVRHGTSVRCSTTVRRSTSVRRR